MPINRSIVRIVAGLAILAWVVPLLCQSEAFGAPKESQTSVGRQSPSPRFMVRGSQIIGPDGRPFVAKGVNINGLNWVWRRRSVDDVDKIKNCWKFNLVRVNSFLFKGEVKWQQYDDNNDLDEIIDAYTREGIVVMLEAHDRLGTYYSGKDLDTLVAFFKRYASKYKHNPYVWFDVMNEPDKAGSLDGASWVSMHRRVISAIRDEAGSNNIIVVEGGAWGQEGGDWNDRPIPTETSAILRYGKDLLHVGDKTYGNIVFSIHTYDMWNFGTAKMANFFARVKAQGFPMFVGEFGSDNDQASTLPATRAMLKLTRERGLGWAVWHWNGDTKNNLVTGPEGGGWLIDSCTHPTNLTTLGRLVWDEIH